MMGQPADQCRCHPLVVKNIHPLGEFQVRIQDDRQVKSVVGYRAAVREPAPKKKKQAPFFIPKRYDMNMKLV